MDDVKGQMEARKAILQGEFDKLTSEAQLLVDQGRVINKRLSEIGSRKLQIQGSFSEITSLLGEKSPVIEPKQEKVEKPITKKNK